MCSCREMTSLRQQLFAKGNCARTHDSIFNLLCTIKSNELRTKLAKGVLNMLADISDHPAVDDLRFFFESSDAVTTMLVEKTLILAALCFEPNFLHHVMTMPGVCSSSLSEFTMKHLNANLEHFVKGDVQMRDFVDQLAHAYVSL